MSVNFTLQDNSSAILQALNTQLTAGAELVGEKATNNVAALTPTGTPESTGVEGYIGGRLKNNMTYRVVNIQHGRRINIGSNLPYAVYVELGTGVYASDGNGRKSPWVWVDKNKKRHWTRGIKPVHMIKRGIEEHLTEYKDILEQNLKG